jgi:hypothetical protein
MAGACSSKGNIIYVDEKKKTITTGRIKNKKREILVDIIIIT